MGTSSGVDRVSFNLRILYALVAGLCCGLAANFYFTSRLSRELQVQRQHLSRCRCSDPKVVVVTREVESDALRGTSVTSPEPDAAEDAPVPDQDAEEEDAGTRASPEPADDNSWDSNVTIGYYDEDDGGATVEPKTRKRRRAWRDTRLYETEEDSGAAVEFFPKPQPTQDTEGYVWLTSYSRIPLPVLQEFCLSARDRCPAFPGPPGTPGSPGLKGEPGPKGDRGLPGQPGPRGPDGLQGLPGPVGPKGEPGIPGLDGRDGLPGEPGLDGVPGRDGIDGKDGRNGEPGKNGRDGIPGINGTDGIPGATGPRGPPGPPGPQGLPGPRGRKGVPGKPGTPGIPGISSWIVNASETDKLLIPPAIVDTTMQTTFTVQEGENVRLKCTATGTPPPTITWRRDDGKPIASGSWYLSSIEGDRFNITRVNRDHMAIYLCIASNGVPPPASKRYNLEVTFPPLIKIRNQMVGTINGSFAVLECFVESFPASVNYWLYGDGRLLESNWKYKMDQIDDGYRTHLILNITYIEPTDYGTYKCVAKNEKGKTHGLFTVFEIDPLMPTLRPPQEPTYTVYGKIPPPSIVEPECDPCPSCPPPKTCPTRIGGRNEYIEVVPIYYYNKTTWRPLVPRKKDCLLNKVGKPVFYRYSKNEWESWMQDAHPTPSTENKIYVTYEDDPDNLYEYETKEAFRKNSSRTQHRLTYQFVGNAHVMYNGSFYYHQANTNAVVRFDLASAISRATQIINVAQKDKRFLYTIQHNRMDIMADENGLWVVYASNDTNNTLVVSLHPYHMHIQHVWNITLHHQAVGEMFIACGVLYGISSVTERNAHIDFAFDLYHNRLIEVSDIEFTNPFKNTNMVSYNPQLEVLFSSDNGNQLMYPMKFTALDLGQPDSDDHDEAGH